ncbi:Reticulocyte-binding protein 2-like protein a [Frankliniella fusca]|uniref:Reticulocyte-binding protein 2-like protein a n=1 Tax=Frankliniella fusca TaxID=407009 RepID=A0AAE1H2T3_9NEOP|nr:Reticulocyte-binding protein 2-like protein a [Frankliniella fusca]
MSPWRVGVTPAVQPSDLYGSQKGSPYVYVLLMNSDIENIVDFTLKHNLIQLMNSDIENIVDFTLKHNLLMNPGKTFPILVGTRRFLNQLDLQVLPKICVMETAVNYCESVCSLGLHIDQTLSWDVQAMKVINRVFSTLAQIRRNISCIPIGIRKVLVNSLIFPHFDYAAAVMVGMSSTLNCKMQRAQNSCVRFVYGVRKNDHVTSYYVNAGWLKLEERRKLQLALLILNVVKTQKPTYLFSNLTFMSAIHSRSSRQNKLSLQVPQHRTEIYKFSFSVYGSQLWNDLKLYQYCDKSLRYAKLSLYELFSSIYNIAMKCTFTYARPSWITAKGRVGRVPWLGWATASLSSRRGATSPHEFTKTNSTQGREGSRQQQHINTSTVAETHLCVAVHHALAQVEVGAGRAVLAEQVLRLDDAQEPRHDVHVSLLGHLEVLHLHHPLLRRVLDVVLGARRRLGRAAQREVLVVLAEPSAASAVVVVILLLLLHHQHRHLVVLRRAEGHVVLLDDGDPIRVVVPRARQLGRLDVGRGRRGRRPLNLVQAPAPAALELLHSAAHVVRADERLGPRGRGRRRQAPPTLAQRLLDLGQILHEDLLGLGHDGVHRHVLLLDAARRQHPGAGTRVLLQQLLLQVPEAEAEAALAGAVAAEAVAVPGPAAVARPGPVPVMVPELRGEQLQVEGRLALELRGDQQRAVLQQELRGEQLQVGGRPALELRGEQQRAVLQQELRGEQLQVGGRPALELRGEQQRAVLQQELRGEQLQREGQQRHEQLQVGARRELEPHVQHQQVGQVEQQRHEQLQVGARAELDSHVQHQQVGQQRHEQLQTSSHDERIRSRYENGLSIKWTWPYGISASSSCTCLHREISGGIVFQGSSRVFRLSLELRCLRCLQHVKNVQLLLGGEEWAPVQQQ